jgi:hypothetical protein
MWGSTTSGCSLLYLRVTDPVHTVICEAQRPCSSHIWGLTTSGCSQSYVSQWPRDAHTVICEGRRRHDAHTVICEGGGTTPGCPQSYVRVNDLGMLTQSYMRVNDLGMLAQWYVRVKGPVHTEICEDQRPCSHSHM